MDSNKGPGQAAKEDTRMVLEEEFGSLDLQNEIERLKKHSKADDGVGGSAGGGKAGKKKKKKKKK
jgi:hypothetical protein